MIDDFTFHPAKIMIANKVPIVIGSDSPTTWNTLPLTHDFFIAFMTYGGRKADLRFLKKLALNSIKYVSNKVMKFS